MFVCLSERDDSYVPQRVKKRALKEAGLGEKKIIFSNKNGQFEHTKLRSILFFDIHIIKSKNPSLRRYLRDGSHV